VKSFGGTKSLVLSTTSWLGGKNPFLGWAYIVVGILCVALAILFGVKEAVHGRFVALWSLCCLLGGCWVCVECFVRLVWAPLLPWVIA